MTLSVRERSVAGNVIAAAWSNDGLVALVMRSGWRGPPRAFVLDPERELAVVAALPIPITQGAASARAFFPTDERDVLLICDGAVATRWNARTGEKLCERTLLGENESGHAFGWLPGGRALVSRTQLRADGTAIASALEAVHVASGARTVELPGFHPTFGEFVETAEGDYVVASASAISRLAPGGAVRWQLPPFRKPSRAHVFAVERERVLAVDVDTFHAHDLATGALLATFALPEARQVGIDADGSVWAVVFDGCIRWLDPTTGETKRELSVRPRPWGMAREPGGHRALVCVNHGDNEHCARVVDLRSGKKLYQSLSSLSPTAAVRWSGSIAIACGLGVLRIDGDGAITRLHAKPASWLAVSDDGTTLTFLSAGKIFVVRRGEEPRVIGRGGSEGRAWISAAGERVMVLDEHRAQCIDVASEQTVRLTTSEIERWTIEAPDRAFFDERAEPHVVVDAAGGAHVYTFAASGCAPVDRAPPADSPRITIGQDEVLVLGSARLHLAHDGKSGLVEDGTHLAWIGPPAKARACRTIVRDATVLARSELDAIVRPELLHEVLQSA